MQLVRADDQHTGLILVCGPRRMIVVPAEQIRSPGTTIKEGRCLAQLAGLRSGLNRPPGRAVYTICQHAVT